MKTIDLSKTKLKHPVLIIKKKTGVQYTNQVDGFLCNHPSIEGVLCEIHKHKWYAPEPFLFEGDKVNNEICRDYPSSRFIEAYINSRCLPLKVLEKGNVTEAWIKVKILKHNDKDSPLYNYIGRQAILTYENSD